MGCEVYSRACPVRPGHGFAGGVLDCYTCHVSELEKSLYKCPICFKWSCEPCATHAFGRHFCSKRCSDEFFHGDDDDE